MGKSIARTVNFTHKKNFVRKGLRSFRRGLGHGNIIDPIIPPMDEEDDERPGEAGDRARGRRRGRGRASTILTGPLGVSRTSNIAVKALTGL